jgi:hypothetical protein
VPAGCRIVSELSLRRLIGLAPPLPSEHRTLTAADVARQPGFRRHRALSRAL